MTAADSHTRRSPNVQNWHDANQRFLNQSLEQVRQALIDNAVDQTEALNHQLRAALNDDLLEGGVLGSSYDGQPFTVELLARIFELNEFELSILLLCAGMELDKQWAQLCRAVSGKPYPTFGLALSIFKKASWEILTPSGTLRRSHLIKLSSGSTLVNRPLHIDERILHYLTGVQYLDERLQSLMTPVYSADRLIPSHTPLVKTIVKTWTNGSPSDLLPVIQLNGKDSASLKAVAFATCQQLGLTLQALPAEALPTDWQQLKTLSTLCEREYQLSNMAILLHCEETESAEAERIVTQFIDTTNLPLMIASRSHHRQPQRTVISLNVMRPNTAEQQQLWERGLGKNTTEWKAPIEALTATFNMSPSAINTVCLQNKTANAPDNLWHLCRMQIRAKLDRQLDDLAQRIETQENWDSLVLPEAEKSTLKALSAQVAQRSRVYEDWGFARENDQAPSMSALFIGARGTGKTTAAKVIAHELKTDIYRINLNSVVSEHIDKTQKALRHIFDTAANSGVTLLFDHTDAIIAQHSAKQNAKQSAKQSQASNTEDRRTGDHNTNRAMAYLLQRMATYEGLTILTTRRKDTINQSLLHHFHTVVQFPFPNEAQRADIWQKVFPTSTPTEGLAPKKLAQLNITGGNIRDIALTAAFIAAAAKEPVMMKHIQLAAEREYLKLEKPLADTNLNGSV